MRKSFFGKYAMLALIAAVVPTMFNSCKDYDGKIDNLQDQINGLNTTLTSVQSAVSTLQTEISNGSVITSVTENSNGVTFTLSNGKTYTVTNGKDGADGNDGAAGADADVWTIGSDGYWYKNGVKTDFYALGNDGKDGADGIWYVPDASGYWKEMPAGTITSQPWAQPSSGGTTAGGGVSVAYAGNYIIFSWDEDGELQTAKIYNGVQLSSLDFIPSVLNPKVDYPTTDDQIYYVDGSLTVTGTGATSANYTMYWGIDHKFNKSNIVTLEYRLSPSDANVEVYPEGSFINRDVERRPTRAAGDMTTLMNVESDETNNGVIYVNSSYNQSASNWIATDGEEFDFVAYQIAVNADENEPAVFTTDYIAPDPLQVSPRIVENPNAIKGTVVPTPYYDNVHPVVMGNTAWENNNYLVNWTGLGIPGNGTTMNGNSTTPGEVNLNLYYVDLVPWVNSMGEGGGVDLLPYVALYGYDSRYPYAGPLAWMGENFPNNLGFDGITYKFSIPEEYLATDTQKTNQQWFVELDGSVLMLNAGNLNMSQTNSATTGTQAIGRTPVVRVDALMQPNKGQNGDVPQVVATSYIKIMITQTEVSDEDQELEPIQMQQADKLYRNLLSYDALTAATQTVQQQSRVAWYMWQDFNNNIYGNPLVDLSSSDFWNYYGQGTYDYTVTVSAKLNNPTYQVFNQGQYTINNGTQNLGYTQFTGYQAPGVVNKNLSVTTTLHADQEYNFEKLFDDTTNVEALGILFSAQRWAGITETTNIEFFADYDALTQLSYQGGTYNVTVTILSDNVKVKPDITLYQSFSITNDFPGYTYNVNYFPFYWDGTVGTAPTELSTGYFGAVGGEQYKNGYYQNGYPYNTVNSGAQRSPWYVSTKGKVVNNSWALQMNTMEAFAMQNATDVTNGQNVFQYWADPINGINYNVDENVPLGLTYQYNTTPNGYELVPSTTTGSSDQLIQLVGELTDRYLVAPLQYVPTFYNTETWDWYFNVLFRNPFIEAGSGPAKLYPNYVPGVQYVNVAQYVQVNDESGNPILVWDPETQQLALTEEFAVAQYKLSEFEVSYEFDTANAQYQRFAGQLTKGEDGEVASIFEFDGAVTVDGNNYEGQGLGVVTYWNNGATTVTSYTFPVIVTVTFPNICQVQIVVPFSVYTSGTPSATNGQEDNTTSPSSEQVSVN